MALHRARRREADTRRTLKLSPIGVAGLLLAYLASACLPKTLGDGSSLPGENRELLDALRGLHFDRYLEGPPLEAERALVGGWELFRYQQDDLRCVEGGEYSLAARPGTRPDGTVVWLDGGGACWPGRDDCSKDARFNWWIEEGGLASPNEDNPVRAWNFVYVPYCDGSLHMGDAQADYDGDGVIDHWHWGMRTTSAAARLTAELFPESERILIAGCSAGGAGTIGAAATIRLLFPEARLYVLNISGLGLVGPSQPDLPRLLAETWNIDDFLPADCQQCRERLAFMYSWMLDRDPGLRVGVYSTLEDRMVSSGWGMDRMEFRALLLNTTDTIHADHSETFRRFLVAGDTHCAGDYSVRLSGVSLWEWIGYLVGDDPRWVDLVQGQVPPAEQQ